MAGLLLVAMATSERAAAQVRRALVIGNSEYLHINKLRNPVNDAADMAAKLRSLQFEVTTAIDATYEETTRLVDSFVAAVTSRDVALVFFAGHAVTMNSESFVLPVDVPNVVELEEGRDARASAAANRLLRISRLLEPLQAAKLGILFLDACRTELSRPDLGLSFQTRLTGDSTVRSVAVLRGTSSTQVRPSPHSAGVFRAYATQLDNVASDGSGRNSPFTEAMLQHIGTPGQSLQDLMIQVRRAVMRATDNAQVPWEESALNEPFYFAAAVPAVVTPRKAPAGRPAAAPPVAKEKVPAPKTAVARPPAPKAAPAPRPPRTQASSGGGRPSGGGGNSLPPGVGVGVGSGL